MENNIITRRVCMLAYAEYYTDARIKSYVNIINSTGAAVDMVCLSDKYTPETDAHGNNFYFLQGKYQGESKKQYLLNYLSFLIKAFFKVTYLHFRNWYKVYHIHNQPDFLVFCCLIPKMTGAKIILDMHDIMFAGFISKFGSGGDSMLIKAIKLQSRLSVYFADKLITADHSQRELLEEAGIRHNETEVFLNLPDPVFFHERTEKQSGNSFRLIYHGTITKRLGLDLMLKAVEEASKKIKVEFTIIGRGELLPELKEYSDRQGLTGSVIHFKDFIPVEKLQKEIEQYDAGIIGNRRTLVGERAMLPVKLLEYASVGLPVIVPRLYVIKKYFDEDMAFYYEPDDSAEMVSCIIGAAQNPSRAAGVALNSKRFFEKHGFVLHRSRYLKFIAMS